MDLDKRALDRYLTRADDDYDEDDERVLTCTGCGSPLHARPDRTDPWEDTARCDGTVRVVPQEYSEGLIDILGEEFRGKTYDVAVSDCGIEVGVHEPHVEVMWAGVDETRVCRSCGTTNVLREG